MKPLIPMICKRKTINSAISVAVVVVAELDLLFVTFLN